MTDSALNLSGAQTADVTVGAVAGRDVRQEGVPFERVAQTWERYLDKEPQRQQLMVTAIERTADAVTAAEGRTAAAVAEAEGRTSDQIERLVDVVDRLAVWAQRLTLAVVGQVAVLAFAVLLMVGLLVLLASPRLVAGL